MHSPQVGSIPVIPCRVTVHYRRQLSFPRYLVRKSKTHHICVFGNGIMGTGHPPDDVGGEMASRPSDNANARAGRLGSSTAS
jgi:hypothetical protein